MTEKKFHDESVNRDEKNIPISERMRSNLYADSPEKLEEDLIDSDQGATDGMQVKSDDPGSQEWDTREDVQEGKKRESTKH